jgi:superfamily II DNA or RNA helicase
MTSLTNRGYGIIKSSFTEEELTELRNKLTVKPFNMMDMGGEKTDTRFPVYIESSKKIYVPKAYGLKHYGHPHENKLDNDLIDIDVPFNGTLRETQLGPVESYMKAANDPKKRGGIINLVCASGKTVLALYIISKLGKKALVVVHKEFLLDQWKERIKQFLPTARIGMIKGPICDVENKDIIIGSLQSLSMKNYSPEVFKGIGISIADEAHHLGAEVFSRVFHKATTLYSLGLSATVNRKDGLTKVFKWHIGDIVHKGVQKKDNMKIIFKEYYDPNYEYSREYMMFNKKPNMSKMINNICNFIPRSEFVIECLVEVLEKEPNRKVLILSDRRNHLENFKVILDKIGIDSGLYYGGLKQEVLQENENKQVLLGTYSYVSEGFDKPGLNTMILASPKSDIIQSVGRILRDKKEDREYQSLVIDIEDKFSIFPNQAKKRLKYYESQLYEIESDRISTTKTLELVGKCFIVDDENDKFDE